MNARSHPGYSGRCRHILKYEQGLWIFLNHLGTPLTNNEAERCLRGSVIMRKICYGTRSDRGEKFRSRLLSVVETCKKHKLSPITVISAIITTVVGKKDYPDVFVGSCQLSQYTSGECLRIAYICFLCSAISLRTN